MSIVALTLAVMSLAFACYAWYFAHYEWMDPLVLNCKDFGPPPMDCHGSARPATWPWFIAPGLFSALGIWGLRRVRR